jgi:ATP-dependent Clp endopeptidase proteolytic subunit ClpP
VNFKYTIDANVDEPIMLLEGSIGAGLTDSVNGAEFSKELLHLGTLNKKSIQVWINSEGGSVTHGNFIYNTILLTKTPVNTLCVGMAASIACVIFQSGKKRSMMSNAFQMMHNPYSPDKSKLSEKDKEVLSVLKASIVNSISLRSGVEESRVSELMDKETYYGAKDCLSNGFCDEVINVNSINNSIELEHLNSNDDLINYRNQFKPNYQNLIKKTSNMKNIKNKLGLSLDISDESLEQEVLNKIKGLELIQDKLVAAEAQMTDYRNKFEAEKAAFETYKNEVEKNQLAELTKKANSEVERLQSQGKIAKEISVDVKNAFVRQFVNNWDEALLMYDSMPININGEDLSKVVNSNKSENSESPMLSIKQVAKEKLLKNKK